MANQDLDLLSINTIRTLSIDAVQQAKSGHPGTPMALAPLVYTLWNRVMRFDPQDPSWPNRDRFVLQRSCLDVVVVRTASDRDAGGERRIQTRYYESRGRHIRSNTKDRLRPPLHTAGSFLRFGETLLGFQRLCQSCNLCF
jgi:hypothetical protein